MLTAKIFTLLMNKAFKYLKIEKVAQQMKKSRSWLSQRLHGHKVNNKVVEFTPEEREMLKKTLKDIASDIIEEADNLENG